MPYLAIDDLTLRRLQSFTSIEEMNEAVKWYKSEYELNKTDCAIIDAISRYACKYKGVSFLNKQSLAEDAGFTSRRTAIRSCNRLEALGIITQYETRRTRGDKRQSVNIIVLENPFDRRKAEEAAASADEEKESVAIEAGSQGEVTTASHGKQAFDQSFKKAFTYKETGIETEVIWKRALKAAIPQAFYDAFSPFFDAQTLYDVYGVLLRAKAKLNVSFMLEDYAERYIDHFYNVIRLYKSGKVKKLQSYLYVTWERLTAEISRQRKGRVGKWDIFKGVL